MSCFVMDDSAYRKIYDAIMAFAPAIVEKIVLDMNYINNESVCNRYDEDMPSHYPELNAKPCDTLSDVELADAVKQIDCWMYNSSEAEGFEGLDEFKVVSYIRRFLVEEFYRRDKGPITKSGEYDHAPWGA